MIRTARFASAHELTNFLHAEGISDSRIITIAIASEWYSLVYVDGDSHPHISGKPGGAGISYGEVVNAPTPAGFMVNVTSKRTPIAAENLGAGTAAFTATLALGGYVTPKSVLISDDGGAAPSLVDNGLGALVLLTNNSVSRGTIDYTTGDVVIRWHNTEAPTGDILADYSQSDMPGSSAVPPCVELNTLLITCVAGAGVTTVAWAIYEDALAAFPPIASGSETITAGGTVAVPLGDVLSMGFDLVTRGSRWVKLTPDNGTNEFQAQLRWKNPSYAETLG